MTKESKGLDILGIQPFAEAINTATTGTVNGAAAFLGRICLPAAEEFGLLLRDRVRGWRSANIAAITLNAEKRLECELPSLTVHAHPRIVSEIIEEGSWIDDSVVQDMWGGLLSSSCTVEGDDDSNLIFVNMLSGLTKLQARVLSYSCAKVTKWVTDSGLIQAHILNVSLESIEEITGEKDVHRLDRELDHLREMGLIDGGFDVYTPLRVQLTPSAMALHMYIRCQGSRASPLEYYESELPGISPKVVELGEDEEDS